MICQNATVLKSKFKILIPFVFLVSPIFLVGKNSNQSSSIDEPVKTEIEVLFEKMEKLRYENMDSCLFFYEKALEISGENEKLQGTTNMKMAWVFLDHSKYKEAIEYFNKGLKTGEQINDNDLLHEIYSGLGIVHWSLSNLSEALNCELKTLDIGKKLKNDAYIARSKLNLGVTYAEIKEYEKSYTYYIQAKEIYEKLDDTLGKAIIVNNLCRLLLDQKKYKEALQFVEEELPTVDTGNDQALFCLLQANHAVALIGNGKMEGFSQLKKSFIKAEVLNDGRVLSSIAFKLSKWNLKFGLYDDALEMTEKGIEIGKKYGIIKYFPELYLNLSTIYRTNKNFKESLLYLEKSNQYEDELLKKRKEKEMLGMEVLNLLKEEEMENELLQLKNSNQRILNFFLIFSFLLFVPYLYFVFKRRQRKQVQKFKQRVAADLHDDIGGNLSTISRIAKGIKDQSNSNEINERVEELVKKSNQSIRNMVDTVWSLDEKESQLRHLIDKMQDIIDSANFQKNDTKVEFTKNIKNESHSLSMEVRHHLLMIFKEGIHNIQKHTVSDFVKLNIQESKNLLQILIYNQFQTVKSVDYSTGRGLENMEKRVQELGGQINLEKSSNHFSIQINLKI